MPPPLTVVFVTEHGDDPIGRAFQSAQDQLEGAQLLVAGRASAARETLARISEDYEALELPDASPAEVRNAAVAAAAAPFVCVVEPHEWLGPNSLQRHFETLRDQPELVASYGRAAVHSEGRVRIRPEHGKGGLVQRRILTEKHLLAASSALVWKKAALGPTPYAADLTRAPALRLSLGLSLAAVGPFGFHTTVVAERDPESIELTCLEEFVRVLCKVIYDPTLEDEKVEQRARVRLARYLVAIGKLHYRAEDYPRAGRFFDEAVKAAPGYFKGRRYQFLNFIKTTLDRDS
ncbi:MAG: hypothetical protein JKY65_33160 [Planctomycetes bacterium]|nr:hypothetical protein [Planctomycetota bacterium]